ncbi:MAG: 16S rRNA (cytosine(967)-C(5))-methyltransferase RsmB [Lachnospiraceae bacterium]|nr:16S rRNA (cytosine(967)-C(5))-methyltransferase RsmB [Lachnospiraceae bacterium]
MAENVNERQIVIDILTEVDKESAFLDKVLSKNLKKYQNLPEMSRAFISRLSRGCVERQLEIDHILSCFCTTPVKKQKPVIRAVLRSGVYQLKYMDNIPQSAVCNEAVKIAEKRGFRNLKGFVNGVLRNIARGISEIEYPDKEKEPVKHLSVRYSMPEWLIEHWIKERGFSDAEKIAASFYMEEALCIRTNTARVTPDELKEILTKEGVKVTDSGELPYAFFISGYDYLTSLKSFNDGLFYVQDLSSQLAIDGAGIKPGDKVLDVCAAPGGKSSHAAELAGDEGSVLSRDLTDKKVALINENIERCGLKNWKAEVHDATKQNPADENKYDVVIADLPCSGLGVLRGKPDIKYRQSKEQLKELVALQAQILDVVKKYVKQGGTLLFSTCTINKSENEENVKSFLKANENYSLVSERQILPDEKHDGFFFAYFKRNN